MLFGIVIDPITLLDEELKLKVVVPVVLVLVAITFKYQVFDDPSKLVGLKIILDLLK